METVLRHCFVMSPKEYRDATNDGDDVFYCEYEYDVHWHNFKRLADIDDEPEVHLVILQSCEILFIEIWFIIMIITVILSLLYYVGKGRSQ